MGLGSNKTTSHISIGTSLHRIKSNVWRKPRQRGAGKLPLEDLGRDAAMMPRRRHPTSFLFHTCRCRQQKASFVSSMLWHTAEHCVCSGTGLLLADWANQWAASTGKAPTRLWEPDELSAQAIELKITSGQIGKLRGIQIGIVEAWLRGAHTAQVTSHNKNQSCSFLEAVLPRQRERRSLHDRVTSKHVIITASGYYFGWELR